VTNSRPPTVAELSDRLETLKSGRPARVREQPDAPPNQFAAFMDKNVPGALQVMIAVEKLTIGLWASPPAILGAYTAHNGLQNLNVFWRTPEGKPASFSRISTYKMSGTDYSETLLFSAMNDGSDKPTTYNLTGSTESTPVAREGGRLAFKLPFDEPSLVFEGDKFTATAGGEFVDYWERVR
jgi:hypothetical protein